MYNKILIGILFLVFGQMTFAGNNYLADYSPGFYFGGQGGLARIREGSGPEDFLKVMHDSRVVSSKSKEVSKGSFGGRAFLGYSVTPCFGVESGFSYYFGNKYEASGINSISKKENFKFDTDLYSIDLMLKGILPLEYLSYKLVGWNVYAKLGAAFTRVKYEYAIDADYYDKNDDSSYSKFSVRPGYAIGVGYDFGNSFGVDLSLSGIYSRDKIDLKHDKTKGKYRLDFENKTPLVNMIALGFTYKF